jgi:hypothetical protein
MKSVKIQNSEVYMKKSTSLSISIKDENNNDNKSSMRIKNKFDSFSTPFKKIEYKNPGKETHFEISHKTLDFFQESKNDSIPIFGNSTKNSPNQTKKFKNKELFMTKTLKLNSDHNPLKNKENKDNIFRKKNFSGQDIVLPTINYKINKRLTVPNLYTQESNIKKIINEKMKLRLGKKKSIKLRKKSDFSDRNVNKSDSGNSESFSSISDQDEDEKSDNDIEIFKINTSSNNLSRDLRQILKKNNIEFHENKSKGNHIVNDIDDDLTIKKIEKIKKELEVIQQSEISHKNEYVKNLFVRLQNKYKKNNPKYKEVKNILSLYENSKALKKSDFAIISKIYVKILNPVFQINNMISFPDFIKDKNILTHFMEKNKTGMDQMTKKYLDQNINSQESLKRKKNLLK